MIRNIIKGIYNQTLIIGTIILQIIILPIITTGCYILLYVVYISLILFKKLNNINILERIYLYVRNITNIILNIFNTSTIFNTTHITNYIFNDKIRFAIEILNMKFIHVDMFYDIYDIKNNAIFEACALGYIETIKKILNVREYNNDTLEHMCDLACRNKRIDVIKFLLLYLESHPDNEHGTNRNIFISDTILYKAYTSNDFNIIKYIIKYRELHNNKMHLQINELLYYIINDKYDDVIKYLIDLCRHNYSIDLYEIKSSYILNTFDFINKYLYIYKNISDTIFKQDINLKQDIFMLNNNIGVNKSNVSHDVNYMFIIMKK